MALNDVRLFGQIDGRPKVHIKRGAETPHWVEFMLKTLTRTSGNANITNRNYDVIRVSTKEPEMIEKIQTLHEDDVIVLKGVFCTKDVQKSRVCQSCEEEIFENGMKSYVHPVHVLLVCTFFNKDGTRSLSHESAVIKGRRMIEENVEISNECILDGRVVTDVSYFEGGTTEGGNPIPENANYKIRVKRTLRIAEDPIEKKEDYPVICTYHNQARLDKACIFKGSRINVRGSIRSRSFERENICPICGYIEKTQETVAEINAVHVEYTHNYNEPEKEE